MASENDGKGVEAEAAGSGDEDSKSAGDARPAERAAPERSRKARDAKELLTEEILYRSQRANAHLKNCLSGKIIFDLDGKGERYFIDWSGDTLKSGPCEDSDGDCVIKVSEATLMKIASGDLNPQVAMLSDKVKIQGKSSLAMYIFNLIGARQFLH
ncbi:MAG: SCP2 sterol-binding domain-containing protein [Deltaproteobacteria bacterium]|nr:SCP2 sterol-binding domain-containing protein [Deltaproteobacteria bacterium]